MSSTQLILGEAQRAALQAVRELAARHPVDALTLAERIKTSEGKRAHMKQMTAQSVDIPLAFCVAYSIETGQPIGTCRHMSMSSSAPGRVPSPDAVWMIAEALGFVGGLTFCHVWLEELQRPDGRALTVNVVQPLMPDLVQGQADRAHLQFRTRARSG